MFSILKFQNKFYILECSFFIKTAWNINEYKLKALNN